jgi:rhodanese-related sulfurtransferase
MSEFDTNSLPVSVPLIFICRSGTRSGQVASTVAPEFSYLFNMTGGMKAWNEAGLPMVSENGTPEVA